MKKTLFCFLITGFFFSMIPAWAGQADYEAEFQAQTQEWQDFWQAKNERAFDFDRRLKDLDSEKRRAALFDFQQKEYREEKVFREKMHQKHMKLLGQELDRDPALSENDKKEIFRFKEGEYARRVAFFEKRNQEDIAFYRDVLTNPSLTPREKKEKSQLLREEQKKRLQEYRAAKEAARQEFRERKKLNTVLE